MVGNIRDLDMDEDYNETEEYFETAAERKRRADSKNSGVLRVFK